MSVQRDRCRYSHDGGRHLSQPGAGRLHSDCIFFFGQNVGTNSPRMLHQLQDARERGLPIVTFNPSRERGLVSFVNPLSPTQMPTGQETAINTQYHHVKVGGDIAAITGICKRVIEANDAARTAGGPSAVPAQSGD